MTFSYDNALPEGLDVVRFLLRDTEETGAELSDEEINYWVNATGNSPGVAALICARSLYNKYAKLTDREVGDLRIWSGQRTKYWAQALEELEKTVDTINPATIYVAGVNAQEAVDDSQDISLTHKKFKIGQNDIVEQSIAEFTKDTL